MLSGKTREGEFKCLLGRKRERERDSMRQRHRDGSSSSLPWRQQHHPKCILTGQARVWRRTRWRRTAAAGGWRSNGGGDNNGGAAPREAPACALWQQREPGWKEAQARSRRKDGWLSALGNQVTGRGYARRCRSFDGPTCSGTRVSRQKKQPWPLEFLLAGGARWWRSWLRPASEAMARRVAAAGVCMVAATRTWRRRRRRLI